jgi:hypothetical protein
VEIHQQADTNFAHAEVSQQLCPVRGNEGGNRFDLDDDGVLDNNIGAKSHRYRMTFINDRHYHLTFERYPGFSQFQTQTFLIHRLKNPGPDDLVNPDRQPDYSFRQSTMFQHKGPPWFSVVLRVLRGKKLKTHEQNLTAGPEAE